MPLRRVSSAGEVKWKHHQDVFISKVLAREVVGLVDVDEDLYEVYLGSVLLGWFYSRDLCFVADRAPRWHHTPAE
jgi:hypothetical protein